MEFRFLLDEDTEADIASYLSKSGYDVERVVTTDALGQGADDHEVMEYARKTDRIIVTHDKDYIDPQLVDRHAGVFFVPNQRLPPFEIYRIIDTVVNTYGERDHMEPILFLTEDWL